MGTDVKDRINALRKTLTSVSFVLVTAVMALFLALALWVADSTSDRLVEEAERTVRSVVKATTGQIDQLMSGVETALGNSAWIVPEHLDDPDYMYRITRELVANNRYIVGSTVAFEPGFFKSKGALFAPYTCQEPDGSFKSFSLTQNRDGVRYHDQGWYRGALDSRTGVWSEPYFDDGGAKILMSTFSLPLRDAAGKVYAIFTADLSLKQLTDHVDEIRPFPGAYADLYTSSGSSLVRHGDTGERLGDQRAMRVLDHAKNGWTLVVTCPIENIVGAAQRMALRVIGFSILGLLLIFGMARFFTVRLQRTAAQQERMESELVTARNIQINLLPRKFPPNVSGILRPAREVGGDLYDFVERGDILYFIVGDASGKGVPAALFSFMAVTVFRMACLMDLPPGEIVGRINAALVRGNDMCMFVTAFLGRLDRRTGVLDYCSAGHNAPVVISPDGTAAFLPAKRHPPTGAVKGSFYTEESVTLAPGSRLVTYTDGVTEAERVDHTQFGNARLLAVVSGPDGDAVETTQRLKRAVDEFVHGAEQIDDITIMTIGCR